MKYKIVNKSLSIYIVCGVCIFIFFMHMINVSNRIKIEKDSLKDLKFISNVNIGEINDVNIITLKGHFDKNIEKNTSIFMYSNQFEVEIKKNGEEIYCSEKDDPYPEMIKGRTTWLDFKSPGISKSDNIEIIIKDFYNNIHKKPYEIFLNNLYAGDRYALLNKEIHDNIVQILVGIIMLIVGTNFFLTVIAMKFLNVDIPNGYIPWGMILISGALCTIIDYDFITLIFSDAVIVNIFDYFNQMILCEFIMIYFRSFIINKDIRKIITLFIYIWAACLGSYLLLQIFGIKDIVELSPLFIVIVCILLFGTLIFLIIEYKRYNDISTKLLLISGIILGVCSAAEAINFYITHVYWIVLFQLGMFIFTVIQFFIMMNNAKQNILKAKRTEMLEKEVVKMKTDIMLSQIQPHFIFNALLAIKQLCCTVPEKAADAVDHFALFLRNDLDSIGSDECIIFDKELNHVKNYLYLEKLRYEENLKIVYDINAENFMIPPLTLQPIVENAVRYGIKGKRQGGTVTISTNENDTEVLIKVHDNGSGFDVNQPPNDGRKHIGIENVRNRLATQCGGRLIIKSEKNIGTFATIIIPKIVKN